MEQYIVMYSRIFSRIGYLLRFYCRHYIYILIFMCLFFSLYQWWDGRIYCIIWPACLVEAASAQSVKFCSFAFATWWTHAWLSLPHTLVMLCCCVWYQVLHIFSCSHCSHCSHSWHVVMFNGNVLTYLPSAHHPKELATHIHATTNISGDLVEVVKKIVVAINTLIMKLAFELPVGLALTELLPMLTQVCKWRVTGYNIHER